MASSISMTSSFIGSSSSLTKLPTPTTRRVMVVKAAASSSSSSVSDEMAAAKKRRDLVFGATAAAAAWVVAKVAMADEEPKAGSPEAKKKYAQVCISNPTARVCRKGPNY